MTASPTTQRRAHPGSDKPRRRRKTSSFTLRASAWFLLPILAVLVMLYVIPLFQTFYYSLTDYRALSRETHFVGFENYVAIFNDANMVQGLSFTVLFTVATTVLITVCAIPLAVALNKAFFGRSFARSTLFFLGVPSLAILGLVWGGVIFSPLDDGTLNTILSSLGLPTAKWMADPTLARGAVIFVAVWAAVGWHATLYLAYLQSIPADLYEQAQIDGASGVQQFFHITVPQLIPAIVVSTFLLVTGGLKVYDLPYAMAKGGPAGATYTVTQSIIVQGISQGNYGLGSALAVLFTVASLAIVMLQLWVVQIISRRYT